MNIVPALDILDGKVVRLSQGRYDAVTEYPVSPADFAKTCEDNGLKRLHLVDLDGARFGAPRIQKILRSITESTGLEVDAGGGIRSEEHIQELKDAGAFKVVIGSMAVTDSDLFTACLRSFGEEFLIVALDCRVSNGDAPLDSAEIAVRGWTAASDQSFRLMVDTFVAKKLPILCTEVARDGMMSGPAIGLYTALLQTWPELSLVASGGVRGISDLRELEKLGVHEAIIGKTLLDGVLTFEELKGVKW